ncbi:HlyD family secretion protein [Stutzerimonas nitrititolerans]|uniref:HlyD family secretion protein n=1 Tax=Stutzerimonas nitrititolerans TaxID=2482751 RepID=UPI0028A2D334|nr:HlyD family secretion protein [Stutzerimonas nitrititolerans]
MTNKLRYQLIIGAGAAVIIAAALLVLNYSESSFSSQRTDDAHVRADFVAIVPEVSGSITEVLVEDNQKVDAGAVLLHIDERKLRIAATDATAAVASLQAQLERQQSLILQARSAVAASAARLRLAESNRKRFANLARDGSGTVQAQQQAEAEWAIQRAAHEREQAGLQSATQQVAVLRAGLEKARAAEADAKLNLSYARVHAPIGGVVAQRRARVGGYARAGEPLLTLVPLDKLYIEANFRETQLARVQPGQPVDISVDALPGVLFKGHVESLGPASGASFSTVPPHNATGNFTKIVQRLPVRIALDPNQEQVQRLRVGMSVRPSIDVDAPAETGRAASVTAS